MRPEPTFARLSPLDKLVFPMSSPPTAIPSLVVRRSSLLPYGLFGFDSSDTLARSTMSRPLDTQRERANVRTACRAFPRAAGQHTEGHRSCVPNGWMDRSIDR